MKFNTKLEKIIQKTEEYAVKKCHGFVTPEHVLHTLTCYTSFKDAYSKLGGDIETLKDELKKYLDKYVTKVSDAESASVSTTLSEIFEDAAEMAAGIGHDEITLAHYLTIFMECCDSFGCYYLMKNCKENNKYTIIKTICETMGIDVIPPIEEICNMIDEGNQETTSIFGIPTNGSPLPILLPMLAGGAIGDMQHQQNRNGWKELTTCLNDEVEKPNYIPLIGREDEINETIVALLRREKSNPVHVGDAGVGKTAITMGLAKRINEGKVPEELKDYKIYSFSMSSLLAGAIYRGEFEEKLKQIFEGAAKEKTILYIDEIHTICGAGGSSASDAANILKPYLLNGSIKVIGATTTKEYRKSIEADSALERRFLPITIDEPTVKQTKEILNGIRGKYEDFHKCVYPDSVIDTIISLANKHMNDRKFPDKAIDIMDEAGAYVQSLDKKEISVTNEVVEEIIAKKCGIPRESVSADEVGRIQNLAPNMKKTVIGQDDAVDKIKEQIVLSRSGLREKNKPVANLLFVGPTGVGKTFIAQTLADQLGIPLIKKDMSEFMEAHSVAKLFGSPAGYVGYDEGGLLVNEIRKTPYCVLLIDEIEKAHPDVYNVFLQIMEDARLSDSFGKSADFSNVILIMTSNAGAADVKFSLGFNDSELQLDTKVIEKAVKNTFSPEFINRLDAVIQFNPMSESMARQIVSNQLNELSVLLKEKKVSMTYSDDVVDYIVKNGYSKQYGARHIKRIISKEIISKLGTELLFGSLKDGGKCELTYKENSLCIN